MCSVQPGGGAVYFGQKAVIIRCSLFCATLVFGEALVFCINY